MKLLSDFDGVWTHPREESRTQGALVDAQLVEWSPPELRSATAAWIADARRRVLAQPDLYGWAPGGRLSCFADEDPFAEHSALLHYIHLHAGIDPVATALHEAVLAPGHDSLEAFGGHAHAEAVAKVEASRGPGVLAEAARAGHRMLHNGVEIVVVSNSGREKLDRWFGHARLPHVVHPESVPGSLRLRGGARKFVLDPERSAIEHFGALSIETARPFYEKILLEETPDAVVGDVFSLDLALPLVLRRTRPGWERVRLFWLVHDYSPARIRAQLAAHAPEVEPIEDGLAGVARALLGS
ncbi:MAG: hypothetical protein U0704_14970 [Candidatus Eisenbacteria bacterium]